MAGEWPLVPIGEVAKVFDGPHATPKTIDAGPIFLGIGALQNGRINLSETRHVTLEDFKTWTRRVKPQAGDIVFSYETRLGEAAMIPEDFECCLGRRMGLVRTDRARLDPRFFLYTYLSPYFQDLIRSRTIHGATVDRIALKEFPSFQIPLPDIQVQRAIAHILGTLDDKIELNRKQNETLEAMARALFKAWFVDFEPVRAKMEGRWQRGQSLPGLPAHLYDLFPDRLVESELGEIPEGWEMRTVGDFADLQGGKQLEKDRIVPNGEIPVFGGAGVMGYTDTYNADGFVIAVGRVGAYCGQFFSHRGKAWINNNASLIRQKKEDFGEWLFLSLRHADIDVIKKGAAQPFVSNGDLSKLPLVWPSEKVVESFLQFTVPLLKGQEDANRESKFLALLRDTLLPKLISGELRIADAEAFLKGRGS